MARHGKLVKEAVPVLPSPTDIKGAVPEGSTPQYNFIAIGESTVAGVGVKQHKEGLAGSLAKEIAEHTGQAVGWRVYATSGYTAYKVSKKILPKIEKQSVDLIVIGLGANDAFTLNSPMKWAQQIKKVIEEVQSLFPEVPIVMLSMPPIKDFPAMTWLLKLTLGNLINLNGEALENVVRDYDKVYYNSEKISFKSWSQKYEIENDSSKFFSDGIHPSNLTYQIWARDVMGFVKMEGILK